MRPPYISLAPLVVWKDFAHPIRWPVVFGRTAELEVEIGFGLGDLLVSTARQYPQKDFVGIELDWMPVRRALRKIALAGVRNVRLVRADARVAFERLFGEKSLAAAYAFFPCPWPKTKHLKNRLFSHDFLKLLNNRLKDRSRALIVTDSKHYFDWIRSQTEGTGFTTSGGRTSRRYYTKYERKWRWQGREYFYALELDKINHISIPSKEDSRLRTHYLEFFDPDRFHPANLRGDIMLEFKESLYDPGAQKAMVRVVVSEEHLLQELWIEIRRKEKGWLVRPAKGCGWIPTAGVQRALDAVRDGVGR
jgi:tRNA (guanine-N7-)-methyltransferase